MRRAVLFAALAGTSLSLLASPPAVGADPVEDDVIPPVITVTKQPGGVADWYAGDVTVPVNVVDSHAGATGVGQVDYTILDTFTREILETGRFFGNSRTFSFTGEGSREVVIDAWDRAENPAREIFWVGIDRTPPTIDLVGAVRDQSTFVVGQQAVLQYGCSDAASGLIFCAGDVGSGHAVDTSTPGTRTIDLWAQDAVGNRRDVRVTYHVVLPGFSFDQPVLSGEAQVGGVLRASATTFDPTPTGVTRQWTRNGVVVPTADPHVYPVGPADLGATIGYRIVASRDGYRDAVGTATSAVVRSGRLTVTGQARLTGRGVVGEPLGLTLPTVTPTPDSWDYRWRRNGEVIAGATQATYTPTVGDAGATIAVTAIARRDGYEPEETAPVQVRVVAAGEEPYDPNAVAADGPARVIGAARVGQVLRAGAPRFTPTGSVTYRWLRDGTPIARATGVTYRPSAADAGSRIAVRITGSAPGRRSTAVTSAPTAPVARAAATVKAKPTSKNGRNRVVVRVSAPGLPASEVTGKVAVRRGKKVVGTARVRNGRAVVRLKRLPRGQHRLVVRYAGSPAIGPSKRKVTLRVR